MMDSVDGAKEWQPGEGYVLSKPSKSIRRLLELVREHLGMDVAHVSRLTEQDQVLEVVDGDQDSFGFREGGRIQLDESYCGRLVDGQIGNIVADTQKEDIVVDLGTTRTAEIGAYIGVPIVLADGRLYGTICCLSHDPNPSLNERDVALMRSIAGLVADHIDREALQARTWKLQLEAAAIHALSAALEARDGYTGEHSEAVLDLCFEVATRLGLPEEDRFLVRQSALLHDIGKIGIPDSVLRKPGALDDEEWTLMKQHPVIGARIVEMIPGLQRLAPILRAEHERWDGRGYPDGLAGDRIPVPSRIVLACDAYHAMVSDRPYRAALGRDHAIEELRRNSGTQFDPQVVEVLIASLASMPADVT